MNLYIIMLQLPEGMANSTCQEELRNIGEVAALIDNGFLLRTSMKATEVRDYIRDHINPQRSYVTKVSHGAAWSNVLVPNSVIKEWYKSIDF